MGVAAATLVALVVGGFWLTSVRRASASTPVGGRRTVTLPDGGRIELNTNTKVSWKFDGSRRRIWLERGEANVVVPSDSRPCSVMAGDTRIVLHAGNLNARLTGDKVTLAVLKGDCTLSSDGAGRGAVSHLSANESAVTGAGATHVQPLTDDEVQSLLAWRQDELVFHGETLQAAVDEYNRYLTTRMVIIDPSIADIRLGGRFKTNDPEAFLSALHSSFDIQANTSSAGAIVLSR
jgi:transmembrane sensor